MTHFGENVALASQITDPISLSYSGIYSTVKSKLLCRHSKNQCDDSVVQGVAKQSSWLTLLTRTP